MRRRWQSEPSKTHGALNGMTTGTGGSEVMWSLHSIRKNSDKSKRVGFHLVVTLVLETKVFLFIFFTLLSSIFKFRICHLIPKSMLLKL